MLNWRDDRCIRHLEVMDRLVERHGPSDCLRLMAAACLRRALSDAVGGVYETDRRAWEKWAEMLAIQADLVEGREKRLRSKQNV